MKTKDDLNIEQEIFELKKRILEISFDFDSKKHLMKIKELGFIRENDRIRHEQELERQRIKTSEIRKAQQRTNDGRDFQRFSRP